MPPVGIRPSAEPGTFKHGLSRFVRRQEIHPGDAIFYFSLKIISLMLPALLILIAMVRMK